MSFPQEETTSPNVQMASPKPEEDDEPLTVLAPKPKLPAAGQSQWVGRRGKPRCDHCRSANLKCDRVLPVCNHCSWAEDKECKYTPLPTPAHRGIPRCDRCRAANQKCDRNLPVCGHCKDAEEGKGVPCNYTPKKRGGKRALDGEELNGTCGGIEGRARDTPKIKARRRKANDHAINPAQAPRTDHTFYGQNVASTSTLTNLLDASRSTSSLTPEVDPGHTGRFTANIVSETTTAHDPALVPPTTLEAEYNSAPRSIHSSPSHPSPTRSPMLQYPFVPPNHGTRGSTSTPSGTGWSHPSFIPLPDFALRDLARLDYSQLPSRLEFDTTVWSMILNMIDGPRETALLGIDTYMKTAQALRAEEQGGMSDRMHSWTNMHRMSAGYGAYHVILVPRDAIFSAEPPRRLAYQRQFMDALMDPTTNAARLRECQYTRLPVQNQLYDILSWAHRNHTTAGEMLKDVDTLGFAFVTWTMAEMYAQMCPHCSRWRQSELATVVVPTTVDTIYSPAPQLRTALAVPTWSSYVPVGF